MKPAALFVPEDTPRGRIYHPANEIAARLAAIAGAAYLTVDRLGHIRALGFEVAETNGTPIPISHPWKGYRRKAEKEPGHVMDEA